QLSALFFLLPRPPPRSTLFPYTTLFRSLVDTSARHQRTAILGRPANSPLVIAPTGLNGMLDPQGDLALTRAAARLGVPFTLSTIDRKSTRLNSSHLGISYAVFCLKKKKK